MWHSLAVHGGTSAGGREAVIVQHDDAVVDLPQFGLGVMGDGDDDMPALVGDSDSDEEDIHAPPGPAAAAGGFANPGHQD